MKIIGTINIMGMNTVIFRRCCDGNMQIFQEYERCMHDAKIMWMRRKNPRNMHGIFYRENEDIMSTLKALALNPKVKLTFNDGAMYIDFIR